jgi:hypothetical protein
MFERHQTKIVTFGGFTDKPIEYKGISILQWGGLCGYSQPFFAGMAGAQVLEWVDLDSEIKTAGLKNVSRSCSPYVPLADLFE